MSLREGNDDAATFRTRIPLPTRKPASALAAATANVVTATTTPRDRRGRQVRARGGDAPVPRGQGERRRRHRARPRGVARARRFGILRDFENGADPKQDERVFELEDHRSHDAHAPRERRRDERHDPRGRGEQRRRGGGDASIAGPEYEDVLASRLAGKDAKFDFKAQVAAAKAFYPKAKTLLKTFRGVIVDIAGAVEDARRENANAILEAVVAAEDAVRDRDETSAARRRAGDDGRRERPRKRRSARARLRRSFKLRWNDRVCSKRKPRPRLKRWKHSRKNSPRSETRRRVARRVAGGFGRARERFDRVGGAGEGADRRFVGGQSLDARNARVDEGRTDERERAARVYALGGERTRIGEGAGDGKNKPPVR